MVVDISATFKYHIKAMTILGLWVNKDCSWAYKIYALLTYILIVIPIPSLPIAYLFLSDISDLFQAAQNLFLSIQMLSVIFKNYSILNNFRGVEKTFELLYSKELNGHYSEQDQFIETSTRIAKRNSLIFLIFCILSLTGWSILPLVTRSGRLPVDMWFFDMNNETSLSHCLKYIYLVVGVSYGASSHCVLDTLAAGLIAVAGGQLKILKDTLQHLTKYTNLELKYMINLKRSEVEKIKDDIMYEKVKTCVKHHKAIIEFVENIQSTYSTVMFWQLVVASVVICMSMVLLTFIKPFSFHFYFQVNFILTMMCEIYMYTFYGTELYYESTSITEAIYLGDWYNYHSKTKKTLIILMERTKKPMLLMGGYVVVITIDTFTTILRRAYSLFAVVRNFK